MAKHGIFEGGVGLFTPARKVRAMQEAAELDRQQTIAGLDIGLDELLDSTADPGEAKAWRDQFDAYKGLALSHNEDQQRAGLTGLQNMATAVREAVDRRHERQETFVMDAARELRTRHEKATAPMRELQASAEQLNALLADPEFEQNMTLNRGQLMTLLQSTSRQMLTDPADMADALAGAGGSGLIGSLIKLAGGALAAEDFNFSKEDYARIARAQYLFNEKRYRATVQPIELEAAALDDAAVSLDFLPTGYSLTRYVTGGDEQFTNPYQEHYPESPSAASSAVSSAHDVLGKLLEPGGEPGDVEAAAAGPEFPSFDTKNAPWLERFTGVLDIANELNADIEKATGAGATVRADPKTGDLFAIYEDGRREPLPTSTVKRSYVQRQLRAGERSRTARGAGLGGGR